MKATLIQRIEHQMIFFTKSMMFHLGRSSKSLSIHYFFFFCRYTSCFLGLQHYLTMFGATVSIPFILCPLLCIRDDDPARGYIISTIFFVSGIVTLLQSTFGCRLPIIQGGTFSFLVPTISILSLADFKCPTGLMDGTTEFSAEEK